MEDNSSIITELVGATTNIPAPVQTAFFKTLGQLLGGLTAIPSVWLRRQVQAGEDITHARSTVAALVAKGVAENALADPAIMQAAAEIYLPTEIRKAKNKVQIAQLAAEEIKLNEDATTTPAQPTEDWMNFFTRVAEDASGEDLQRLFARILAGEIITPGAFSRATMRVVSELDKSIAEDFTKLWERSVGVGVDYTKDFEMGEWYLRWKRLEECGLVYGDVTGRFPPEIKADETYASWMPMYHDGIRLLTLVPAGVSANWTYIEFTRAGRELGSVLAPPNIRENMKQAGKVLASRTKLEVFLYSPTHPTELLTNDV